MNGKTEIRHLFQRVFRTPDGKVVLGNILYNLGYFDTDASKINPAYIAFANKLLHDLGINVKDNLQNYLDHIFDCATDRDVIKEEK